MKAKLCRAFTLLELVVVMALAFIMVGLFMPPTRNRAKAVRIYCANNLKQVGFASRISEGDNGGHYSMLDFTDQSDAPLYPNSANVFRYFQVMTNGLYDPRVLFCPADNSRKPATNFSSDFDSGHISYFVGLNAGETKSQAFLSGDSNITNGMKLKDGLMEITTNQFAEWTKDRHNFAGNVGLADGSVQQFSSSALRTALQHTGFVTNRLLFP